MAGGNGGWYLLWKIAWCFLVKQDIDTHYSSAISLLGICQWKGGCTKMFAAAEKPCFSVPSFPGTSTSLSRSDI